MNIKALHSERLVWLAVLLAVLSGRVCFAADASDAEQELDAKTRLERAIALIRATKIDDGIAAPDVTEEPKEEAPKEEVKEPEVKIVQVDLNNADDEKKIIGTDGIVINKEVMKQIEELSTEPGMAANPYLLADILFECGRLMEASVFYKETYRRIGEGDTEIKAEKDWVLLQVGNSLRKEDKAGAIEAYKQMLSVAPGSAWADIARTNIKLLEWYVDNNVEELLSTDVTSIEELE